MNLKSVKVDVDIEFLVNVIRFYTNEECTCNINKTFCECKNGVS